MSLASACVKTEPNALAYGGLSMSMFISVKPETGLQTLRVEHDAQPKRGKKRRAQPRVPLSPNSSAESDDHQDQKEDYYGDDAEEEEQFKRRHNASERKRQATINDAVSQIKEIIFSHTNVEKKFSKGAILKKTVDYMHHQHIQSTRLHQENVTLHADNRNLTEHIHLLNAILTVNGLTPPSFPSTPVNSSLDDDDDDHSHKPMPSPPANQRMQTAAFLAVFVFSVTAFALSGIHLETTDENFAMRALQDLKMPDLTSEYIALVSVHTMVHVIGGWLLFFFTMFIQFITVFTVASFIKQMCEPVIHDDDSLASLFHDQISYAESYYSYGNLDKTEFHIKEAINLLFVGRSQLPDFFSSSFMALLHVVFELLRSVSHRVMIGIWADQLVMQLRGTKQYNYDLTKLMFMQSQLSIMVRTPLDNKGLLILYQLLVTLNNAEVGGPSSNTLFALGCMGMSWYFRVSPSSINGHSEYVFSWFFQPISTMFRHLAWRNLANADVDSRLSLGRLYIHVSLDFFSHGRLKDAIFSLSQAMDIHQKSKSPGFWRVAGICLMCVLFYQESFEQVLRLLRLLESTKSSSSGDKRFENADLVFQTLIMLKVSTNKADAHRALVALTETYNNTEKSKTNKMEGLLALSLALCRHRCGDIAGAWEIVKSGAILANRNVNFFYLIVLEGYCELMILLLDCKINNVSFSSQLPARQEVEQHVTSALATMNKFSNLYPVSKPAFHMRNAMYLNILGQQQKARVQLQQAQKSARGMKLQAQLKHASRMLEQLENDINLQKNYSAVLNIQV